MTSVEPFKIRVDQTVLDDLKQRLLHTRWPRSLTGQGWSRGVDMEFLRDLCVHWAEQFDWRQAEEKLNQFDQCIVEVNGLSTHAIHVRSPEAAAIPLILTHGWPGTFAEFTKVIGPLSDPVSYGGDPSDAFHVVCPSIPGYGFSAAPDIPGFDIRAVGTHLVDLMSALGYERFGAQGGDWGALATNWMALDFPERLIGAHLNLVFAFPPQIEDALDDVTPIEQLRIDRRTALRENGGYVYVDVHGFTPHALAPGLSDSPVGLAAWIVQKYHSWTDHQGSLFDAISIEDVLTQLTIYWATNSIGSSIELYCESIRAGTMGPLPRRVTVPTAGLLLPMETLAPPRGWAETYFNIARWTELKRGGHFAAMEQPAPFVEDVQAFFRDLR